MLIKALASQPAKFKFNNVLRHLGNNDNVYFSENEYPYRTRVTEKGMGEPIRLRIDKLGNGQRRSSKTRICAAAFSFPLTDQRALPGWPEDERFRDVIAGKR